MVWVAVFERNILLLSSGGCLKMEVVCYFRNSVHSRLFCFSAQGHNFSAFWIQNEVMKLGGGGEGVWYGIVLLGV
jgi:hypothetical protein